MTKLHKAKILDENSIQWEINEKREIICLLKMTASDGNDCSEWISFDEMYAILKERGDI